MVHIASGNFVTAQPYGVRGGDDMLYAGEVGRLHIDIDTTFG
jgi:hypothetical protein